MSNPKSRFLRRFDRIWSQARRVQLVQALCWGILAALAGLGLLAAGDYLFEMSRNARLIGLGVVIVAALGITIVLVVQSLRRWQRNATAAAIEVVFPQLGQRIRTTVQYGEMSSSQIEHEGVATTLVTALEEDTVRLAQPLPLDAVIPWKSLAVASLLAAVLGLVLTGASAFDWQWATAAQRTFLAEKEYTEIEVGPGNVAVREGESVLVEVRVIGRLGDGVRFFSRPLDEENAEWEAELLVAEEEDVLSDRERIFETTLERLKHPVEYRIVAGSSESELYKVDVLYPLKIVQVQAAIQPPAYTGIGEQVVEGGNISALVESKAKLMIELDRPAAEAWLQLQPANLRKGEVPPELEKIPLTIDGVKLSADLVVSSDSNYEVFAKSADGMEVSENKYRIRARSDEAPQVWFESPSEALEVHTLAEILMRIRVSDDFGIAQAGIVFEVNNEEEYPLLSEDFQTMAEAATEAERTGELSAKTRATLEKVLPLEHFELTQQDSIMYYAYAEDTKPGTAQRAESDLRFIDVRPFRRLYRVAPEGEAATPMGDGPQLKSLEELISRQRHALNRTIQMNRKFVRSGQADLSGVDSLVKFEAELAKHTRELAQGLLAMGIDETELLYQAESSMLAATDSLSAGSYDTATLQMRDALKNLIEGRNRLEVFIRKNRDKKLLAQLRQFDRLQRQKLRRPKTDNEEARQLADRLQELSDRENMLKEQLASLTGDQPSETSGATGEGEKKPDATKDPMSSEPSGSGTPMETDKEKQPGGTAEEETETKVASAPTPQELEDKQLDIALEARELEKTLARLPKATDLAKERIAAASKTAEEAAAAVGRGAMDDAQQAVGQAGGQFAELAEQVRALLTEEPAEQIAAAQQMANQLAREQQDFMDKLASPGEGDGPGNPTDEEKPEGTGEEEKARKQQERRDGLGAQAEKIAEKARTLQDVLSAAGKAETPEDESAAEQVAALVERIGLTKTVERLGQLPGQIGSGQIEDAKNTAGEGSEQMESAAEQLGALHRVIVAPDVDQLAKVDEEITVLTDKLDELDAQTKVGGWHQEANDLLEDLDKMGLDEKLRDEFLEEMKRVGYGRSLETKDGGWVRTDAGFYQAPQTYRTFLHRLSASVQNRLQELMLADLQHSGDEPVPPQYQEMVDRYQQVLVTKSKKPTAAKAPSSSDKP
jgi:hypothetical protein